MKTLLKAYAISAMLTFPLAAYAEDAASKSDAAAKPQMGMNCPMMGDMQKYMGAMMKDMGAMMDRTNDPALKDQMQKMHEQMGAMMDRMHKMGSNMMGGGMMGGGMMGNSAPKAEQKDETAPSAPVSPEDHKSHHPEQ